MQCSAVYLFVVWYCHHLLSFGNNSRQIDMAPFCRLILKSYRSQKIMTSLPESRLSLGIKRYWNLVIDKNGRSPADGFSLIFNFLKIKFCRFADILHFMV